MAFATLQETLSDLRARDGLTEKTFAATWQERLAGEEGLTKNGYYDPPPGGVAVIFADEADPTRLAFQSLRPEAWWPSDRRLDWRRGLLHAYCSPVHLGSRRPGDLGVTLYFGSERGIREHLNLPIAATQAVLAEVQPEMSSRDLFERSQAIFAQYGLRNNVVSQTDSAVDLGHLLPILPEDIVVGGRLLDDKARDAIRDARRFVSAQDDWLLQPGDQLTIEPSLVRPGTDGLP